MELGGVPSYFCATFIEEQLGWNVLSRQYFTSYCLPAPLNYRMRKSFRTLALLLFVGMVLLPWCSAHAQSQPESFLSAPPVPDGSVYSSLTSSASRNVISLNGVWQVSNDDGDNWANVTIPSSFVENDHLIFRRSFNIPPAMLKNYRWVIVAYGVQYQSTITVNDQFVVQHESGMPFSINLPEEVVLKEKNTIAVEVTNQLDYTSTVPLRKLLLGNRTFGGVFRDILLVGVPRVWIDDVGFDTRANTDNPLAKFKVRVVSSGIKGMEVKGGGGGDSAAGSEVIAVDRTDFELSIGIREIATTDSTTPRELGRGALPFPLESKRTASLSLDVAAPGALQWGPGAPNLYDAVVQVRYKGLLVDEQIVRIGFRSFESRGNRLLVNGQPITVKGIAYVEDDKLHGASLPYELMRKDIQTIRDMGVNVIRFVDGVPHPYLLRLCDEFGLMAFVDISIGTPPLSLFSDKNYLKRSLDRARFTVEEANAHASVVAYGLSANIPAGSATALDAVRKMRGVVDSLDHRLFYFSASDWSDPALRKLADIAGITSFDVDPPLLRGVIQRVMKELKGERPLVVLNYGKFVQLGNHGGYKDDISIEAQAKYISDIYNILLETKAGGGVYWSFNDYRTDRPILTVNNADQFLATCGLYGLDRDLRQGATMLAALYTEQKPPEVLIGDYTQPSTVLFIAIGIACAVVFLLLINSSRRFRENVFRALLRPFNFYSDIRDQRILSTFHTTVLGIVVAVTFALIVASLCYYYRMDEGFDATLSAIITADWMKVVLNYIIWRPVLAIVVFTFVFFGLLLAVALLIRGCAVLVRNKIFFRDTYVIAIWGALPVLTLIVPAMILYRLLEVSPGTGVAAFSVMVLVVLWMIYRVLRGTAVIYDVRPTKVYGYAIGSVIALIIVLIVTSGEISATLAYLREGIGGLYLGR